MTSPSRGSSAAGRPSGRSEAVRSGSAPCSASRPRAPWPSWSPPDGFTGLPLLVAPIGASAVLVFAIPASPLAQPARDPGRQPAVGPGRRDLRPPGPAAADRRRRPRSAVAILLMSLLGCLHPPGGAMALGAALAGGAAGAGGLSARPCCPVGALLGAAGAGGAPLYARPDRALAIRTGRRPSPTRTPPRDTPAVQRVGYTPADLDRALDQLRRAAGRRPPRTSTPCSARSSCRPTGASTPTSAARTSCPAT